MCVCGIDCTRATANTWHFTPKRSRTYVRFIRTNTYTEMLKRVPLFVALHQTHTKCRCYLPGTIRGPFAAADRGPLPYLTWLGVAFDDTTAISSNSWWPWTSLVLDDPGASIGLDCLLPVRLCINLFAEVDIRDSVYTDSDCTCFPVK